MVVEKNVVILHSHLEKCLCEVKSGNSSVGRAQPCQGWGREFESRFPLFKIIKDNIVNDKRIARGAKLVDAHVSGACVLGRAGSIPVPGTPLFCYLIVLERWRNW